MFALKNAIVYTGYEILHEKSVIISGNKIHSIVDDVNLPSDIKVYDCKGNILTAGFIDLQLNGCGGVQFSDKEENISIDTLLTMQKANEKSGCTSFLPTLITSTDDLMRKAMIVMNEFLKNHYNQALGLHLEGPWISTIKKGTHDDKLIRKPDKKLLELILQNSNIITKITLAPENVERSTIESLVNAGILVSSGHSNATYKEAKDGFNAGIRFATHLFNAMPPITGREPGLVAAILDEADWYTGIIADGLHISFSNVNLAYKLKKNKLCLVTDAVAPAGSDIKEFFFAGKRIFVNKDGVPVDENGVLSGSALTMIKGLKNLVQLANVPLFDALRMANLYPAQAINRKDLGEIATNKIANLVVFNSNFEVLSTFVNGNLVFGEF